MARSNRPGRLAAGGLFCHALHAGHAAHLLSFGGADDGGRGQRQPGRADAAQNGPAGGMEAEFS